MNNKDAVLIAKAVLTEIRLLTRIIPVESPLGQMNLESLRKIAELGYVLPVDESNTHASGQTMDILIAYLCDNPQRADLSHLKQLQDLDILKGPQQEKSFKVISFKDTA